MALNLVKAAARRFSIKQKLGQLPERAMPHSVNLAEIKKSIKEKVTLPITNQQRLKRLGYPTLNRSTPRQGQLKGLLLARKRAT